MTTINFNTQRETSIARWTARLLSVLLALFIASLFAFNDDVRAEPSLPLAIMLVLSAGLLAGWYSERAGAWSGLLGAPILSVSFLFVALEENTIVPLWMVVGIAAATGGAYGLVGWLYASVNRYQALSDGSDEAGGRAVNPWLFLLLGAVTVAVLFFLGVPSVLPVTQEIQSEPVGSADMTSVIDDLRRAGAVVGVGSVPRTDTAFAVSGTELLVGQEAVWLFEYPTISAATEDARAILDGKLAVEGSDVIQRANVLLLFSGVSAETRALVIEALGPPLD